MPAPDAPPPPPEPRDPAAERHNARLGLRLFAVYFAGYAGFVAVTALAPADVGRPVGGLTAAVVAGFALIAGAVVLSLVYALLCRNPGGRS